MPQPTQFRSRLAGKAAIVTGAGSQGRGFGTGKAIALVFAREGAQVCLVDREAERAEATRKLIEDTGGDAFVCAADVTASEDCARVVAQTMDRYGRLDTLVNNVGIGVSGGRVEQLDEAVWNRVMDVNLKSAVLMCKHALPALIRLAWFDRQHCIDRSIARARRRRSVRSIEGGNDRRDARPRSHVRP